MSSTILDQLVKLREELHQYNHQYYVLDNSVISDYDFDKKLKYLELLEKANPQFFDPNSTEPNTFISGNSFLEFVKGRAKELGQQIGVDYAEGFISKKIIGVKGFDGIIQNKT